MSIVSIEYSKVRHATNMKLVTIFLLVYKPLDVTKLVSLISIIVNNFFFKKTLKFPCPLQPKLIEMFNPKSSIFIYIVIFSKSDFVLNNGIGQYCAILKILYINIKRKNTMFETNSLHKQTTYITLSRTNKF